LSQDEAMEKQSIVFGLREVTATRNDENASSFGFWGTYVLVILGRNKRLAFCPQDASAHSQLVGHTTPLRQQATLTLTTKAKLQIERVPLKQQHYNATASPLGYEYCRVRRDII